MVLISADISYETTNPCRSGFAREIFTFPLLKEKYSEASPLPPANGL
jgi:hypothetical protein